MENWISIILLAFADLVGAVGGGFSIYHLIQIFKIPDLIDGEKNPLYKSGLYKSGIFGVLFLCIGGIIGTVFGYIKVAETSEEPEPSTTPPPSSPVELNSQANSLIRAPTTTSIPTTTYTPL